MGIETEMEKWWKQSLNEVFKIPPTSYWICVILSILILILYGKYRCKYINSHKDILEGELFKNSNKFGLDGWSVSHFIAHMIAGIVYPTTFIFTQLGGFVWELFETYVGIYKPKWVMGIGFCKHRTSSEHNKYKVWWYGKVSDIIVNITGFIVGVFIHYLLFKKIQNRKL